MSLVAKFLLPLVFVFFGLTEVSSLCVAGEGGGSWTSGGGGVLTSELNPWYLGEQPIEYCVEIADAFTLDPIRVGRAIENGFAAWKKELSSYPKLIAPLAGTFQDGVARRVSLDLVRVAHCDRPDQQVRFKIGSTASDPGVAAYFNSQPLTTFGFAKRTHYDAQTFRGGGVIWVAPENSISLEQLGLNGFFAGETSLPSWKKHPELFDVIVAHEIGHIFGVPHLEDGLMRTDIFDQVVMGHFYRSNAPSAVSALADFSLARNRLNAFEAGVTRNFDLTNQCTDLATVFGLAAASGFAQSCQLSIGFTQPHNVTLSLRVGELTSSVSGEMFATLNQRVTHQIRFFSPLFTPSPSSSLGTSPQIVHSLGLLELTDSKVMLRGYLNDLEVNLQMGTALVIELRRLSQGARVFPVTLKLDDSAVGLPSYEGLNYSAEMYYVNDQVKESLGFISESGGATAGLSSVIRQTYRVNADGSQCSVRSVGEWNETSKIVKVKKVIYFDRDGFFRSSACAYSKDLEEYGLVRKPTFPGTSPEFEMQTQYGRIVLKDR